MTEQKYIIRNCQVCAHSDRDKIEIATLEDRTIKSISEEFKVSAWSLTNHKRKHMVENIRDQLKAIVLERIAKNELKDASLSEVVATLKYVDEDNKCDQCQRGKATPEDLSDALAGYIGFRGEFKDCAVWNYLTLSQDDYLIFGDFLKELHKQELDAQICYPKSVYDAFERFKSGNMNYNDLIHGEK